MQVGVGLWGPELGRTRLGWRGSQLAGLVDASPDARDSARERLGVQAFRTHAQALASQRCDAVLLVSPPATHRELAEEAVAVGALAWAMLKDVPMKARHVMLVVLAAVVLVLVVAVTAAVITDDAPTPRPQSLAGAAANGLIAYSYAGDIYVGDPATGETTAIVTNPTYEVNPVFSPDGERIAFIRGDPQTGDSTIVVVRADGSDERVLLPKGREHRGFGRSRLDARRRLARRAARHAAIYVPLRRRRALARSTPSARVTNDSSRRRSQRSAGGHYFSYQHPSSADVPPAHRRPDPVRRPKRAERVRS